VQNDGGSISNAVLIPFGDCGDGFGGGSVSSITPDSDAAIEGEYLDGAIILFRQRMKFVSRTSLE